MKIIMKHIHSDLIMKLPSVYFLCIGDDIMYVGSSKTCPFGRICSHIMDGKDFDDVFFFYITDYDTALKIENILIFYYKPEYNKQVQQCFTIEEAEQLLKLLPDEYDIELLKERVADNKRVNKFDKSVDFDYLKEICNKAYSKDELLAFDIEKLKSIHIAHKIGLGKNNPEFVRQIYVSERSTNKRKNELDGKDRPIKNFGKFNKQTL